jgi:hypothetical protein
MVKGSSGRGEMEESGATASGSTERRDQAHHPGRLSLLKWGASLLRLQRCDTKPFFCEGGARVRKGTKRLEDSGQRS